MNDDIRAALWIDPLANGQDRTIDLTTYGAQSGKPHRIETWYYRVGDHLYLTGSPGKRDWYTNLIADPRLILHLKQSVIADLPGTARVITDAPERRSVLEVILKQWATTNPGNERDLDDWVARSPLAEIIIRT